MIEDAVGMGERAASLRRAFDRAFAERPQKAVVTLEDLLAVRIATDAYAIRLTEINGLFANRKVVPLPSPSPELLGVVGFRGGIVPVYDLRALLGYPRAAAPRWLVLASRPDALGLAFDQFEGHLRLPREHIAPADLRDSAPPHVREVARAPDLVRPIVSIASVVEAIKRRVRP